MLRDLPGKNLLSWLLYLEIQTPVSPLITSSAVVTRPPYTVVFHVACGDGLDPKSLPRGSERNTSSLQEASVVMCTKCFSSSCGVNCKFSPSSEIQCRNCIFCSSGFICSSTASAMFRTLSESSGDPFMKKVSEGDLVRMSVLTRGLKNLVALIQSHQWGLCMSSRNGEAHDDALQADTQTLQVIEGWFPAPRLVISSTTLSVLRNLIPGTVSPLAQVKHFAPYMRDAWIRPVVFPT